MCTNEYPCKTCTRAAHPEKCENKLCKEWKAWFLRRWADIYAYGKQVG